jgi:hypothetical protein
LLELEMKYALPPSKGSPTGAFRNEQKQATGVPPLEQVPVAEKTMANRPPVDGTG